MINRRLLSAYHVSRGLRFSRTELLAHLESTRTSTRHERAQD
jgi:hypothetical protein